MRINEPCRLLPGETPGRGGVIIELVVAEPGDGKHQVSPGRRVGGWNPASCCDQPQDGLEACTRPAVPYDLLCFGGRAPIFGPPADVP